MFYNFSDAVISTVYKKYFHPKECLIEEIKPWLKTSSSVSATYSIVYPFGATLGVARPAVTIATTTSTCLPQQRPIAATYSNPR